MSVVNFPKKKDPQSVIHFLESAIEVMSKPDLCPDSVVLLTYFKQEDSDAIGINIGGKPLSPIELSGLLEIAKGQIQFADNMSSMAGEE